jgi:uncharacterized cofD-like protein
MIRLHISASAALRTALPSTLRRLRRWFKKFLAHADMILLMSVNPGFGGQEFMSKVLKKIEYTRALAQEVGVNIDIQVDGGINAETGARCVKAGGQHFSCRSLLVSNSEYEKSNREITMKKIVTIGGGTGNFTVLKGLRNYDVDISAIVSMADDGGSTGILRDELGVLPPGDVRQCLVALSDSSRLMRSLMNYRFEQGGLVGHSFGNLLLSALEKVTGSFEKAVEEVGRILYIKGKVIPVTTHQVRLKMILKNCQLLEGEREIYMSHEIENGYSSIYLEPYPKANPHAINEIMNADVIIVGPGGLHTSLIPNFLVEGVSEALMQSDAKKIFIINLMNRRGQTTHFKVSDYLKEIERFIGADVFDYILVNNQNPPQELIALYAEEGDLIVNDLSDERIREAALLGELRVGAKKDLMKRSLIRHDCKKLASELMKIVDHL